MNRPMYAEFFLGTPPNGHAGLWYEKYCNKWHGDLGEPPPPPNGLKWSLKATKKTSPKVDWVNTVTGTGYLSPQGKDLLAEHHTRLEALCNGSNALQLHFKTTSRLVIGIGQDHPIENGFLWHSTLGVPYIPGNSIKGMLRNWMLAWEGRAVATSWFESVAEKGVGELIFLDALPLDVPKLEADVITPHYGPYYRDPTGDTPPADWHSPVPTPFLTVAAGTKFAVRVIQRRTKAGAEFDLETIRQPLTDAFDFLGIGAKTAVGYGRLAPMNGAGVQAEAPLVVDLMVDSLANPMAEFKVFCRGFGSIASKKGSQSLLIQKLNGLADDIRPGAFDYLRNELNARPKDCAPALKALLFPER